jgi:hypothetical protein
MPDAVNYTVIPAGFYEVAWHFDVEGADGDVIVTHGVTTGATPDQADWDNLSEAMGHLQARMNGAVKYRELTARVQAGQIATSISGAFTGSNTQAPSPLNVAVLVQKYTGVPGKQNHGRWFFPGMTDEAVDRTSLIDATAYGQWIGSVNDMLAQLFTDGWSTYLLHTFYARVGGVQVPRADTTPTEVIEWRVQRKVATQRGRLR